MQFKIPYKREAGGESQRKKIDDGNRIRAGDLKMLHCWL